ncbi:MAG: histidine phosphatase family protein [Candidatus Peribacteria bacterium]|nr:histidine phosphatase family protein [Candidatus Peribacteria bacterium]
MRLRDFPIDVIISSDLGRAKHTAQLILESHITLIPIIYDSLLRERDSGIFQ